MPAKGGFRAPAPSTYPFPQTPPPWSHQSSAGPSRAPPGEICPSHGGAVYPRCGVTRGPNISADPFLRSSVLEWNLGMLNHPSSMPKPLTLRALCAMDVYGSGFGLLTPVSTFWQRAWRASPIRASRPPGFVQWMFVDLGLVT